MRYRVGAEQLQRVPSLAHRPDGCSGWPGPLPLGQPRRVRADQRPRRWDLGRGTRGVALLVAVSGFIGLLAVGVVRRWRWTFWLILVALLFGVLRVPVAVLQLTGVLAADTPTWYVLYQGLLGMAQFGIGLVMVVGYRHAGSWGSS
jgi:hypothetical protein